MGYLTARSRYLPTSVDKWLATFAKELSCMSVCEVLLDYDLRPDQD